MLKMPPHQALRQGYHYVSSSSTLLWLHPFTSILWWQKNISAATLVMININIRFVHHPVGTTNKLIEVIDPENSRIDGPTANKSWTFHRHHQILNLHYFYKQAHHTVLALPIFCQKTSSAFVALLIAMPEKTTKSRRFKPKTSPSAPPMSEMSASRE